MKSFKLTDLFVVESEGNPVVLVFVETGEVRVNLRGHHDGLRVAPDGILAKHKVRKGRRKTLRLFDRYLQKE